MNRNINPPPPATNSTNRLYQKYKPIFYKNSFTTFVSFFYI